MATTKNALTKQSKSKNTLKKNALSGTSASEGKKARGASKVTKARDASKAAAAPAAKRFRVLLRKHPGSTAALLTVPFDSAQVFGTRGRVPVRCTINGFTFRSSI